MGDGRAVPCEDDYAVTLSVAGSNLNVSPDAEGKSTFISYTQSSLGSYVLG